MAAWYRLHLAFSPRAALKQLAALEDELVAADYDAPVDCIGAEGTSTGKHGGVLGDEAWCLWREPASEILDRLSAVLAAHGLHGHGWVMSCAAAWFTVDDAYRFTFGEAPVMRTRIETARAADGVQRLRYAARNAVLAAARSGNDAALVAAAAALRAVED